MAPKTSADRPVVPVVPVSDAARIERARIIGRRVGVIFMLVFGSWFVLTTVYNFAVDVFWPAH